RGAHPHPNELLARHPDLADLLKEYLGRLELLHEAAVRFRIPAVAAGSGLEGNGQPGSLNPEPTAMELGNLGDFQLLREVGRGGMGIVYEAEQISLGRRVALKVLPFASTLDSRQLQRFKNEAQAAACLHHTNIVPVFSTGCERGVHFYAMQFIDGQTVAAWIADLRQPAPPPTSDDAPTGPSVPESPETTPPVAG